MKTFFILVLSLFFYGCFFSASASETNSTDTSEIQAQVLTKINRALSRGSITAEKASILKDQLNKISAQESEYLSSSEPIPSSVVQEDRELLKKLSAIVDSQMQPQLISESTDDNYREIHILVAKALASNKITSTQAEHYYSRLTQIENDMESLKNDPAASASDKNTLTKNLQSLKADVQKNLK